MCHHCFGDVAGTIFEPMNGRHSLWNVILPTLLGIGAYWPISVVYTALTTPHTLHITTHTIGECWYKSKFAILFTYSGFLRLYKITENFIDRFGPA